MNEAAELGGGLTALILFWIWCGLLALLNAVSEAGQREMAARPAREAGNDSASAKQVAVPLDPIFLEKIRRLYPAFDERHFMQGAARAYEFILRAYAAGDLAALRPLLAPDVLAAFERAVADRLGRGEVLDLTFISLEEMSVRDVGAGEGGPAIGVRFAAGIVSATRSAGGEVVDGDPERVIRTDDLWTFEPDPASPGRSWRVTATQSA